MRPAPDAGSPRPLCAERSGGRVRRARGPAGRHRGRCTAQPGRPQRHPRVPGRRDGGRPRRPPHAPPADSGAWRLPILFSVDEALLWGRRAVHAAAAERAHDRRAGPFCRRVRALLRSLQAAPGGWGTGPCIPARSTGGSRSPATSSSTERPWIPDQVAAGVHVRSAILALAVGAAHEVAA